MKLSHAVKLAPDELPASFASRLAANHGIGARELCLDFGVPFQGIVDGEPRAIAKLAELGGVAPEALAAHAFVRIAVRRYRYRGQIIVRDSLRRSRVHVCPACVSADLVAAPQLPPEAAAYRRSIWLIDAIRTCPVHAMPLVEIGHDLAPTALHDFAFHLEAALPRLGELLAAAGKRDPDGLENYVLARLDGTRQSPFLDGLELHAAIRTSEIIGAVSLFGRRANLRSMADNEWHRAGACGFEIAAGGPDAIGEFLTTLQNTYPYTRCRTQGPQALFGRLYQRLEFGAKDPAYDPVRAVVARHIHAHQPLGAGDVVFGVPVTERTLHSIRTLSVETGLHPKRLRKTLLAGGIIDDRQMALPDHGVIFAAERASNVIRQAKGALTLPAAGKYLNAPRVQIHLLAENGFIEPYVPAADFAAYDRYAVADLDDFLRRLLDGAKPVRKPAPGMADIPGAAKRANCSAAEIVRLILGRKLAWTGKAAGRHGYLSALVDVEEIRKKVRGAEHGGLTQRQVAEKLRTTDYVVGALIALPDSPLKTFTAINPRNRCPQVVIRPAAVEKFLATYVSLYALAKERREHFRAVKKAMEEEGIEPAFKPAKIGATFYWRREC